jgi:hypothetical protein
MRTLIFIILGVLFADVLVGCGDNATITQPEPKHTETYSITTINTSLSSGTIVVEGGNKEIHWGESRTIIITPKQGMKINSVRLDNKEILLPGSEFGFCTTLTDIKEDYIITVRYSFDIKYYDITTSCGPGGIVEVRGGLSTHIAMGSNRAVAIIPFAGYRIKVIRKDGEVIIPEDPNTGYMIVFTVISTSHNINAEFEEVN